MNREFRRLYDREKVEIVEYLKQKIEENPETEIYIGCDSQTHRRTTTYAIVVVLHYRGAGGHVLYSKLEVPVIYDLASRLWKEVELSLEVAEYLLEKGVKKAKYIDIDVNPDKKYRSNILLTSAMGLVAWKGFVGRAKPESLAATRVADKLCK
jgi:predicted RNase H-related nuclease YkuK (DUF458 family)